MLRGTELHSAGRLEQALLAFENAQALAPQDVNTASACATLLALLDRPQAAYQTLLSVEAQLMENADGAANLAIAAEACGDLARAQNAYAQALQLDPDHLRSLNNVGILAASSSQWEMAIGLARRCVELQPGHAPHHANLSEFLAGDRRYPEALEVVTSAMVQFPHDLELKTRHIALLAFNGDIEQSNAALKKLDADGRRAFEEFLSRLEASHGPDSLSTHLSSKSSLPALDALDIHARQAFRNMSIGDWRNHARLIDLLRRALAKTAVGVHGRDWHHTPFHGLTLDLHEDELAQMHGESMAAVKAGLKARLPPFVVRRNATSKKNGSRIHVGLALPGLHDTRLLLALKRQLAHHDTSRFAIHVYAFTHRPEPRQGDALRPHAASVAELGHMLDAEAAARMRLDRLDVYMEMGGDSGWSRPQLAAWRVAPVQLRHVGWHRQHVPGHWDYTVSDRFIHPGDGTGLARQGAIVRLPHTCWLAGNADALPPDGGHSREGTGLPDGALVLGSFLPPATLDAESFAVWMKVLRSLPDAVLWLPYCGRAAANLVREAQAAGVGASRLVFSTRMDRNEALARMKHADIFLDTLRCNAASGLEDALRLGVPALTCAGITMASRLGGSILHAAGLPEGVLESRAAYVAEALRLGRDARALQQLRARLQAILPVAPLFDIAARVREWEAALTTMVERSRAGLAPAAFDVPSSTATPAAPSAAHAR